MTISDLFHTPAELMSSYRQWAEDITTHSGVPFGIPELDAVATPMRPGDLTVFMALSSHMKTTMLAILAKNEAKRIVERGTQDKECVVFVTWEQSGEELTNFFLADGDYSASDVAWGKVPMDVITKKAIKGVNVPIWVIGYGIARAGKRSTPRMYPETVFDAIEAIAHDYDGMRPTLMLFDYIQLIPIKDARDRIQQVTEIPHRVKELALRIGAPAVAAVQSRQEVLDRTIKLPTMRDAQWASSIGQTADKVFSLWYPCKTESLGDLITIDNVTYEVTDDLLLIRFLKQRFAPGHGIYPFRIDPAKLSLSGQMNTISLEETL